MVRHGNKNLTHQVYADGFTGDGDLRAGATAPQRSQG